MTHMLQILGIACLTAAAPGAQATAQAAAQSTAHATNSDAGRAAETSPGGDTAAEAPATVAPASGLRVVVDPETGNIVQQPTSRQLERLAEGIEIKRRVSSEDLREFALPGGGQGVFLDGWADHSLRVEVDADGRIQTVCSHDGGHGATEGKGTAAKGEQR